YLGELSGDVDVNMTTHWVQALCNLWRQGERKQFKSVPDDVQRFAFSVLPKLLQRSGYFNGPSLIETVANILHDINGSATALEFLIQRAENEPEGMKELQNDFWQSHGYQIAQWRHESAKQLSKPLEFRLLTIVLNALRDELENQQNRNRSIYWGNHSYFWSEKEPEFIATALEVLDAFPDSESHQLYIADYLYRGLDQEKLATDRLMQAFLREILSWEGIYTLTGYLESGRRYPEAVRILPSLIEERPDHMDAQTRLIRCLEGMGETPKALSQLAETDAYFRSENRWAEPHAVSLARVSLDIKQYLKSAAYYDEAIAMHVKTNPDRGVGNGVLSKYYEYQSRAYQNLGDTDNAIDAIAGAIISRGPDRNERSRALNRLDDIIRNAKDLDAYIVRFEQEVDSTGLDNPILRKALGKYFLKKRDFTKANRHLSLSLTLQPDDKETRDMLLESYSRNDQPNEAIALLLDTLIRSPHDLQNYQDLAKRYQQTEQPLKTERAYTSMVEAMPQESESHETLALVREKQSNWEEALVQWDNVIRIRSKEPTGYLGKLRTLLKLSQTDEAKRVFDDLIVTDWPKHFGNVKQQAEAIMKQQDR
ncbi:MAG: hypothetical protein PF795_09155, partial [Kiritimatiellae bacterium]|nr:hypothetical protein [Kiritimatiellia bacterium]